ncbi:hypothetical protein HDV05_002477, partial [Chytridiales sp. JEL 0842]
SLIIGSAVTPSIIVTKDSATALIVDSKAVDTTTLKDSGADISDAGSVPEPSANNGNSNNMNSNPASNPSKPIVGNMTAPTTEASPSTASKPNPETTKFQIPLFLQLMVIRKILLTNDGRDKVLKCLQYGSKALLWAFVLERAVAAYTKQPFNLDKVSKETNIRPRLEKLIPQLSMARKIVRLFHFLEPMDSLANFKLSDLTSKSLTPLERRMAFLSLVSNGLGVVNDMSDDAVALSKMGVLSKGWSTKCTPLSDRLWFVSILLDVHELLVDMVAVRGKLARYQRSYNKGGSEGDEVKMKAEKAKLESKLRMQVISLTKLGADFVFCSYDVLGLGDKGWNEGWQTISGLTSALLGTYKLYVKHA